MRSMSLRASAAGLYAVRAAGQEGHSPLNDKPRQVLEWQKVEIQSFFMFNSLLTQIIIYM